MLPALCNNNAKGWGTWADDARVGRASFYARGSGLGRSDWDGERRLFDCGRSLGFAQRPILAQDDNSTGLK